MRYYVYISENKVEMLYSQIPPRLLENIAGTLTIDFKLIKTEFSEAPKAKSLHSKLQIVERYLDDQNLVGDLSVPKSYVKATRKMRWGPYAPGLVYFGSADDVILGLGGSEKHVLGNVGSSHAHSHSATPYLIAALREQIKGFKGPFEREDSESFALAGVELATTQMSGIQQNMAFVAKVLLKFPSNSFDYTWHGRSGKPVILGSPLYVSLEE